MSTNVSGVTTNFFPTAQNGFTTTTSGSVSSGATSVGLNSVAGYSNGEVVVLVIDPTDTNKKQTFTGVVDTSGSQITSVKWTAGTNQIHALGATVVDYETATHWALYSKGMLVDHSQSGSHEIATNYDPSNPTLETQKWAGVSSAVNELTVTNAATGNAVKVEATGGDTNVGLNLISKGSGEVQLNGTPMSGAWISWTPTLSGRFNNTKWTKTAYYKQIGKTVYFRMKLVANSATPMDGGTANAIFTLPVTAVDLSDSTGYVAIGTGSYLDSGTTAQAMYACWKSTTTADVRATAGVATTSVSPITWAINDEIYVQGFYEAA